MAGRTPMPMCPMAGMCRSMMERRGSGLMLFVPGIVLIILGVVVLTDPRILLWLVALALIFVGVAMLMVARLMRRFRARSIPG